jgi:hypothetical protein
MAAEVVYDPTEVRLTPARTMDEARDNIVDVRTQVCMCVNIHYI